MRTIWWLLTGKKILRVFSFFHSEQPRMGRQHNRKIKLVDLQGVHFSNLKCQQRPLEDGLRKKGIKERWKLFNEIIVMASCASCFTMEKSDTVTSWTMSSSLTWNMKRKQTSSENQIRWPPKCTRAQDHNKIVLLTSSVQVQSWMQPARNVEKSFSKGMNNKGKLEYCALKLSIKVIDVWGQKGQVVNAFLCADHHQTQDFIRGISALIPVTKEQELSIWMEKNCPN